MSEPESIVYPDISDILALKEEGRRQRSRMTFAEKAEWCEQMWERLEPFKRAREARHAAHVGSTATEKPRDPAGG
jgi:hypothetical protein